MAWGFLALAGLSSLSLRSSIVSIFNRTENLSTSAGCRTSATRSNLKEGLATQISQIDTTFGNMIPLTPSLLAGDLPGYTGWARPTETLTPYFRIVPLETDQLAYPNPISHSQCRTSLDRQGKVCGTFPVYEQRTVHF
jgi:hypothetical protein